MVFIPYFQNKTTKEKTAMNFNGMDRLLAFNIDKTNGKHLFGSLISNGSLIVIGSIAGLAILAAVIIFLRKKKKDNKEENDNK